MDYGELLDGITGRQKIFNRLRNYHQQGHKITHRKALNLWTSTQYEFDADPSQAYGQYRLRVTTSTFP